MRDQKRPRIWVELAEIGFEGGDLVCPVLGPSNQVAERIPGFGLLAGDDQRGLATTAPGAGQHLIERHLMALERGAGAAGLGTALLAEVALGGTIIKAKPRRVAGAGGSIRMAHEHGMARPLERAPSVRLTARIAAPCQHCRDEAQNSSPPAPARQRVAPPQLWSSGRIGSGKNSIPSSLKALASSAVASP